MRRIIPIAALIVTLSTPTWAELQDWEIPIVRAFLLCDGSLASGCEQFDRGDYGSAFEAFDTIAKLGDPKAHNNLGVLYEAGAGVAADKADALWWYRNAAYRDVPLAQYNFAVLMAADHILGTATEPSRKNDDFVHAYMWLTIASGQGLDIARSGSDDLAKHLTADQISQGQRLADEWTRTPEKVKDLRLLMGLAGVAQMVDQTLRLTVDQTLPMMEAYFREHLGPIPDEVIQMLIDEMFIEFSNSRQVLIDRFVSLYDKRFSTQEIGDLIDFYSTDTGRKIVREMPHLMQEGAIIAEKWGREAGIRAGARATEKLKAAGYQLD